MPVSGTQAHELSASKKEVAKLSRLKQQLQNAAAQEATAYQQTIHGLREDVRSLEKQLSASNNQLGQTQVKLKKLEIEAEERRGQLDQVFLKQKLYDAAGPALQQGITARPSAALRQINAARPPPQKAAAGAGQAASHPNDPTDSRASRIIAALQRELNRAGAREKELADEVERLTLLLEQAVSTGKAVGWSEKETRRDDAPTHDTDESPSIARQRLTLQIAALNDELEAAHSVITDKSSQVSTLSQHNILLEAELAAALQQLHAPASHVRRQPAGKRASARKPADLHLVDSGSGGDDRSPQSFAATQTDFASSGSVGTDEKGTLTTLLEETREVRPRHGALDVAMLVSDKAVLQGQLEMLGNELLSARADGRRQLEQLVALQLKVNTLLKEQSGYKEDVASLTEQSRAYAYQLEEARAEAAKREEEQDKQPCPVDLAVQTEPAQQHAAGVAAAEFEKLAREKASVEAALMDISDSRDRLQQELDELTVAHGDAERSAAAASAENGVLHEKLRGLQLHATQQLAECQQLSDETHRASATEGALQAKLKAAEDDNRSLHQDLSQAADDFKQLLRENAVLTQQLQESANAKQVTADAADHLHSATASLHQQLTVKENEYNELLLAYRQVCREQEQMQGKLAAYEKEVHDARDEAQAERQRLQAAKADLDAEHERETETALELQSANYEIEAVNKKLMAVVGENYAKCRELDDAVRQSRGLEKTVAGLEKRLKVSERDCMLLQNQLSHLSAQLEERDSEVTVTSRALADEQAELQHLVEVLGESRKKESSSYHTSERMLADLQAWQSSATTLEKQLLEARQELSEVTSHQRELVADHARLQTQMSKQTTTSSRLQDDVKKLKDTNLTLIRQYESAQALLEAQDDEMRSLKRESDTLRSKLHDVGVNDA
ncbi:BRCT domain-containing protein [Diplonema papillatum]|nr:BRCT domain-containing protein [Diplonema papillatum]